MPFFQELKRRNVFRVGAAYLVVSWLILQIVDTVGPIIALQDSFARGVLLLLLIGFPITLIAAWVFEFTPEGVKTQQVADANNYNPSVRKLNALIIGGLSIAVVFLLVDKALLRDADPNAGPASAIQETVQTAAQNEITPIIDPEKSIAVLPFTNLSDDPEQEYFSDGLSDELINKLSQVDDLFVTGRNSSFYFKGRDTSLQEIGGMLDVAYILQGSVRKSGDNLRILAQLMNARTGINIWSESYDRKLVDIFAIQDDIAEAVTTNLSISLGAGTFDIPGFTRNPQAYDAYQKALPYLEEASNESFDQMISLLLEVVTLDPEFVQGWFRLSYAYNQVAARSSGAQRQEYLQLAQQARDTGINLGSVNPELVSIMNYVEVYDRGDYLAAEQIILPILAEQNENNAEILADYGEILLVTGRLSEALPYFQRAQRLDPLSGIIHNRLGRVFLGLGRYEESLAEFRKHIEIAGPLVLIYAQMIPVTLSNGDWEAARDLLNNLVLTREAGLQLLAFAEAEDKVGGRAELQSLVGNNESSPLFNNTLAWFAPVFDAPELAAEIVFSDDYVGDATLIWTDLYSGFRQLPEFKQWAADRGLLNYWRTSGNWPDKCRPLDDSDFECF